MIDEKKLQQFVGKMIGDLGRRHSEIRASALSLFRCSI